MTVDLTKPHKYEHEIDWYCICGLPVDNPLHIETSALLNNGSLYVSTTKGIYKNGVLIKSNTRDNRIHKEGFDAGYIKGYKKGLRDLADEMNKNIVGNEDSIMVAVKMFRTMDELLEKKRLNAIKKH